MPTRKLLAAINREDRIVPSAVERELPAVSRAVQLIVAALAAGGRLIYVGAGTSGRLAALDAAECPPTFGIPANVVQAVVAGGRRALTRASEDAEDSASQGARDLAERRIQARDVVVGVTASGGTPYVVGALRFARQGRAKTVVVTSNRRSSATHFADVVIAPQTGAEIIAGSTRMKAGTAQKLILNMLSTAAMIRLGRIYQNWMLNLSMTNEKLRKRGLRILQEATGASLREARRAVAQSDNLRVALLMLQTKTSAAEARKNLARHAGDLRRALEDRQFRKKEDRRLAPAKSRRPKK